MMIVTRQDRVVIYNMEKEVKQRGAVRTAVSVRGRLSAVAVVVLAGRDIKRLEGCATVVEAGAKVHWWCSCMAGWRAWRCSRSPEMMRCFGASSLRVCYGWRRGWRSASWCRRGPAPVWSPCARSWPAWGWQRRRIFVPSRWKEVLDTAQHYKALHCNALQLQSSFSRWRQCTVAVTSSPVHLPGGLGGEAGRAEWRQELGGGLPLRRDGGWDVYPGARKPWDAKMRWNSLL